MARRKKGIDYYTTREINRMLREEFKRSRYWSDLETFREHLNNTLRDLTANAAYILGYRFHDVIEQMELELIPEEEKKIYEVFKELYDPWEQFKQGFITGWRRGLRHVLHDMFYKWFVRAALHAYFAIRFESAFVWKGYLIQAMYDGQVYRTVVDTYPEVLQAVYESARFANRYVRIIEAIRGEMISFAHEYLSFLRKKRCHQSMLAIKITPLTARIALDKRGSIYIATFMDNKTLWYSPYSMKTVRPNAWFYVINRRKSRGEEFSIKHYAGFVTIHLDNYVAVSVDTLLRPEIRRKLKDVIFMPHIITKYKAHSIGKPEERFNIRHCSVYFIPERKTRSRKREIMPEKVLFDEVYKKVLGRRVLI